MMRRLQLLIVFLIAAFALQAQIYRGYYDGVTDQIGDDLKLTLHNIIADDSHVSYTPGIWTAFYQTDKRPGTDYVWDIYSDIPNGTPPYLYTMGQGDQCGDFNNEGDCYNREHLWPQSWTSNDATHQTDLHHVFPTDGFVNQQRSNYPFGEVSNATWTSQNGSKLGNGKSSLGYTSTVFEPIDEYKGDIARALMYVSVRYYTEDDGWSTEYGMTNKSVIKDWAIAMLLDWSDNDPVSAKEIARNEAVYGIQGNRNPFIDHPEYARRIWDPNWTGTNQIYASAYPKNAGEIGLQTKRNKTVSIDFSAQGYNNEQVISNAVINDYVSVEFNKGTNSIPPKYFSSGSAIRCYGGNYFTVSTVEGCSITKITLTYGSSDGTNTITTDVVTFDGTNIWNGDASSVKFTIGGSSGNRRIKGIEVKYSYYDIVTPQITDADIDFSAQGYTDGQAISSASIDANVTVAFDKGTNNSNAPKYYSTGTAIRCYGGNTFEINAGSNTITSIELTYGSGDGSNAITTDVGEFATNTWSGHASSVTFTIGGTSGHRRIKKIAVEYSDQQTNFLNGSMLTLLAIPNEGYSFVNWTKDGVQVSCDTTFTFTVTDDADYLANFMSNTVSSNTTVASLTLNGTVTINSNKKLTVTGNITQPEGSSISILNGGQLVCNNSVYVKMRKSITAWDASTSKGWYAIASPVNGQEFSDVTNLTTATHNIYRYDEAEIEWEEYRDSHNIFNSFDNGRGYLFRTANTVGMIEFKGNNNVDAFNYDLSYVCANNNFKGFNLIGNPFTQNITWANIAKTNIATDGYYILEESGTNQGKWTLVTSSSATIAPMRAFLVQATGSSPSVIISRTTAKAEDDNDADNIIFSVSNSQYSDETYVMFREGHGLNKIEHRNAEIPMLYIIDNDQHFAIADMDDNTNVINLGFEAKTMGQYTLKLKADGDFSCLHLIDRITGEDVDMLIEDEYSFIAAPSDVKNRFVVKCRCNSAANADDDIFAYQNGDDIIIEGNGLLQIFDVTGRIVVNKNVNGVEIIGKPTQSGLYVFRLVGEDVKTQKIVVK